MEKIINEEYKTIVEFPNIGYDEERKNSFFAQSIKIIIFIVFLILSTLILNVCHKQLNQMKILKINENYNSEYLLIVHPEWMGIKKPTF